MIIQPIKCINCGQTISGQAIKFIMGSLCKTCTDASDDLTQFLSNGLTVEYADGSKRTYKSK